MGGRSSGGLACEPLQQVIHQLAQVIQGLASAEGGNENKDPQDPSLDVSHPANSRVLFGRAMLAELARGVKRMPPRGMPLGANQPNWLACGLIYLSPNPG
jgi:hypothetical protein